MLQKIIPIALAVLAAGSIFFLMGESNPGGAPVAKGTLTENEAWFQTEVLKSPDLILVNFTAAWCGPCKLLKKDLDQLEAEWKDRVRIVPVDVDQWPRIAQAFRVEGYPTLLLMRNGRIVGRHEGTFGDSHTYEKLKNFIEKHLAS